MGKQKLTLWFSVAAIVISVVTIVVNVVYLVR